MQQDIEKAREAAAPQLKDLQQRLQSVLADAQKQQQQEPAAAGQPSRKQAQQQPAAAGQPSHGETKQGRQEGRQRQQLGGLSDGQAQVMLRVRLLCLLGNKPAVAADVDGSKARPANDDVGNNEGAERGGASGDEEMQDVPGQACEVDEQQRPQAGAGDQALPDQQQPPADQPFTRKQKRRWIYKQKIREKAARENAGQPAAAAHAQALQPAAQQRHTGQLAARRKPAKFPWQAPPPLPPTHTLEQAAATADAAAMAAVVAEAEAATATRRLLAENLLPKEHRLSHISPEDFEEHKKEKRRRRRNEQRKRRRHPGEA